MLKKRQNGLKINSNIQMVFKMNPKFHFSQARKEAKFQVNMSQNNEQSQLYSTHLK